MSSVDLAGIYLEQLKNIVETYNDFTQDAREGDLSDLKYEELVSLLARTIAAVERISGLESPYTKQLQQSFDTIKFYSEGSKLKHAIGILKALKDDLERGYLQSAAELLHANVFADYLGMADHLLEEGYKDAAAVLAGGTLEAHLKQLCVKYDVDTTHTDRKGNLRNKAADVLNADLVKAGAYSKQDQKNVTAWLGLRNDAAHANYDSYGDQQVRLVIESIRNFVMRVPA